jgi:hypothetical protein
VQQAGSPPRSRSPGPIARDALEFGVDRRLTSNVKLGVYYSGLLSSSASENAIKARGDFLKGRPGAVG